MAKKEKKEKPNKKKEVVVEEVVELSKYYFLADVYAVIAVEAEDISEAKEMVKEADAKDFINFKVKKAKLINPKLYMPAEEEEEDEEEDDEPKKSKKRKKGKGEEPDEDLAAEPSPA